MPRSEVPLDASCDAFATASGCTTQCISIIALCIAIIALCIQIIALCSYVDVGNLLYCCHYSLGFTNMCAIVVQVSLSLLAV